MIRCTNCALITSSCVCDSLVPVDNKPHTIIFRHCKEKGRGSNSARILNLCLTNVTLMDYGCLGQDIPTLNIPLENAALVFPLHYNSNSEHPPKPVESIRSIETLILLDGSWKQTARMLQRIPGLIQLPRLEITPANPPLPRVRHPYFEGGMCTMEAGIQALLPFNTKEFTLQLTQNYLLWLDAMRRLSGIRLPLSSGQSFKDARKIQEFEDAKNKST